MRYTVVWSQHAESQLAELWSSAADRRAITAAARAIDTLLAENAHVLGESREGTVRIAFVSPLGVYFEALPSERVARVLHVWTTS